LASARSRSSLDVAEISFFSKLRASFLKRRVSLSRKIRFICGVDASYDEGNKRVKAVAVLLDRGKSKETAEYQGTFSFPYISGLFYLHEGPFTVAAVSKLRALPDIVCFDAHGAAHPNSRGMASVCGAVLEVPSIGLAKSPLAGNITSYKTGMDKITHLGREVGFLTTEMRRRIYWSFGYSVSLNQLEKIIANYGKICEKAVREAHHLTKMPSHEI